MRVDGLGAFMASQNATVQKRALPLGTLTASYRDVHGRAVGPGVPVEWAAPPDGMRPGALGYDRPTTP